MTYDYVCYVLYVIHVGDVTMSPFSVTVQNVPDRELGPLLTQLSEAGFDNPIIRVGRRRMAPPPERPLAARGAGGPPRGLAPGPRAGGRVVSMAEAARSLRALPRVHGHDARRRRRSDRAWRDDPREHVGTRPEVRRRLPEQRIPAGAARRVRRRRRLRADTRARRRHPRQRRRAADVRRRRRPSRGLRRALPNRRSTTSGSSIRAPGTSSSSSPARTTTRRCSTTP